MSDYLDSDWPPPLSFLSARRRRYAVGAAVVAPLVLIAMLSHVHPGKPPDRGIAACASLSRLNQAGAPDFRRLGAQFAASRLPDLRANGTAYADLAIRLRTARHRRVRGGLVLRAAIRRLREARAGSALVIRPSVCRAPAQEETQLLSSPSGVIS